MLMYTRVHVHVCKTIYMCMCIRCTSLLGSISARTIGESPSAFYSATVDNICSSLLQIHVTIVCVRPCTRIICVLRLCVSFK